MTETYIDEERKRLLGLCNWEVEYNPDGFDDTYYSECGNELVIKEGDISDNEIKFCCFCGKLITERD